MTLISRRIALNCLAASVLAAMLLLVALVDGASYGLRKVLA